MIIILAIMIITGLIRCKKDDCKPEKPVVIKGPTRSPDRIPVDTSIVWMPGGLK
jgi:hypothetical protein